MEAILTGTPQFIVTSVTVLITSSQAAYINRLQEMIQTRIKAGNWSNFNRFRWNWYLLISGWWCLTVSGILLVCLRIIPSAFVTDSVEKVSSYFIWVDIILTFLLLIGYSLLAAVAFLAWKPPWRMKG